MDEAYDSYFWFDDVDTWLYQSHPQSPGHPIVPFSATLKILPHNRRAGGSEDPLTHRPHSLWFNVGLLSQYESLDGLFCLKKKILSKIKSSTLRCNFTHQFKSPKVPNPLFTSSVSLWCLDPKAIKSFPFLGDGQVLGSEAGPLKISKLHCPVNKYLSCA